MKEKIQVSIITVCYNAAPMLKETIESVGNQQGCSMEYIVIDGGSTDETSMLLRQYSNIITRWISEPDKGIYDAMNKGVRMAIGEYCLFLNAGDTFASNDVLSEIFSSHRFVDVIYGDVIKEINGLNVIVPAHRFENSHRMCFCHQSVLTSRKQLLLHPYDTKYKMSADFKFYKILFLSGCSFEHVALPIAKFDTNGISNRKRSAGLAENIRVIKETDRWIDKIRFLPRLYFVYLSCKIRGK